MPSQPVLLAFSAVSLLVTACSLLFIAIRLTRAASVLVHATTLILTTVAKRDSAREPAPGSTL
jgi:hypothetical protein